VTGLIAPGRADCVADVAGSAAAAGAFARPAGEKGRRLVRLLTCLLVHCPEISATIRRNFGKIS
jgi:ATP-dependent protease ClpP protease subunit